MMCGGFGEAKEVDETTTGIVTDIKPAVEEKLGKTFTKFEPVSFKTQVVAGTNYIVKVKIDDEKYIHIKVHKPLPCNGTELRLLSAEEGHLAESAL